MQPESPVAQTVLTCALHMTGRYKEAWESLKKEFIMLGQGQVFDQDINELGYAGALVKTAEALKISAQTNYINPYLFAIVYLLAGNKERALECLEKAYEIRETNLPYLLFPMFDIIREEPRFQEIARKMNLPSHRTHLTT